MLLPYLPYLPSLVVFFSPDRMRVSDFASRTEPAFPVVQYVTVETSSICYWQGHFRGFMTPLGHTRTSIPGALLGGFFLCEKRTRGKRESVSFQNWRNTDERDGNAEPYTA